MAELTFEPPSGDLDFLIYSLRFPLFMNGNIIKGCFSSSRHTAITGRRFLWVRSFSIELSISKRLIWSSDAIPDTVFTRTLCCCASPGPVKTPLYIRANVPVMKIRLYIINWITRAFWLVVTYDLLEDRRTNDVSINTFFFFLASLFQKPCRFHPAEVLYVIDHRRH